MRTYLLLLLLTVPSPVIDIQHPSHIVLTSSCRPLTPRPSSCTMPTCYYCCCFSRSLLLLLAVPSPASEKGRVAAEHYRALGGFWGGAGVRGGLHRYSRPYFRQRGKRGRSFGYVTARSCMYVLFFFSQVFHMRSAVYISPKYHWFVEKQRVCNPV